MAPTKLPKCLRFAHPQSAPQEHIVSYTFPYSRRNKNQFQYRQHFHSSKRKGELSFCLQYERRDLQAVKENSCSPFWGLDNTSAQSISLLKDHYLKLLIWINNKDTIDSLFAFSGCPCQLTAYYISENHRVLCFQRKHLFQIILPPQSYFSIFFSHCYACRNVWLSIKCLLTAQIHY